MKYAILCGVLATYLTVPGFSQKAAWRQATSAELASVLPSRATVVNEHIETEMRTASGIVNGQGHFVAAVVLLTAGYSADGKYSLYLLAQSPVHIAGIALRPGDYLMGWTHADADDSLNVHVSVAATGAQVGTAKAKRIPGRGAVESIHIWPPQSTALIQIGRFGIPYKLDEAGAGK